MENLKIYSTSKYGGRGNKIHKNRLKESGVYNDAIKILYQEGFNSKQIKEIMHESDPISEQELQLMLEMKKGLYEIRALIHSAIQYGLIEFKGQEPRWFGKM